PRYFRRQPLFSPYRETIATPDGHFLDLAWSMDYRHVSASNKPVFVLFHDLEGSFESPYANGLMSAFQQQGWIAVLMHFRGCSGRPNLQARAYHSGETDDARLTLEHVKRLCPNRPIIAAGVSLGGNMLTNYLARFREDPIVNAATVISAPLDLAACSERIEQGLSRIYRRYLMSSLKRNALLKMELLHPRLGIQAQEIKRLRSLRDFDELITAPLHNFQNAADYYSQCSGLQRLTDITVPTHFIQAQDDPFMNEAVIPQFTLPSHLDYCLTQHGGHVGFISGHWRQPRYWLEEHLPAYYAAYLQYNPSAYAEKVARS
ncbi:MAG: hydrolase, partial [Vibrio sp.]